MSKMFYYGKYRAKVQSVNDPEKRGRIRVLCPKLLGNAVSNWCEPCIPVAYNYGGDFAVPKVGETVWVEFEAGDVNRPIYTGGWWATNSTPTKTSYDVETRFIEWGGCQIKMSGNKKNGDKATIELTVGNSKIKVVNGNIKISSGRVDLDCSSSSVYIKGVSLDQLIKNISSQNANK